MSDSEYMMIVVPCSPPHLSMFAIKREHVHKKTQKWMEKNNRTGAKAPLLNTDYVVCKKGTWYSHHLYLDGDEGSEELGYVPLPMEHMIPIGSSDATLSIPGSVKVYIFGK